MIQNAKVVSTDTEPRDYLAETGPGRGDPAHIMSASEIRAFQESPRKFLAGEETPDEEETKSQFWGNLMDCILLQPDAFTRRYVVQPETYKAHGMRCPVCGSVTDSQKCAKCKVPREPVVIEKEWNNNAEECERWTAQQVGKIVLRKEQLDRAEVARGRILSDPDTLEFLDCSKRQVFVRGEWLDEGTGIRVPLKMLADLLPAVTHPTFGKCLGDLKTARNAAPWGWPDVCFKRGYHIQAALYLDLYVAATGEDRCDFRHLVQESMPPYEPGLRYFSAEFIAQARDEYQTALKFYCRCLQANKWPGWDSSESLVPGWSIIEPRPWMLLSGLSRLATL